MFVKLKSVEKWNKSLFKFEQLEIYFLVTASLFMLLFTSINICVDIFRSGFYSFIFDSVVTLPLIYIIYLLSKGKKDIPALLLFPVLGNIYIVKTTILILTAVLYKSNFTYGIFFTFQIINTITVAYFCGKRRYIVITLIIGTICNLAVIYNNHMIQLEVVSAIILYTLVATLFAFHINKAKNLLVNYYNTNLNKNREINHRIKNQLTMLRALIELKSKDRKVEIDDYKNELLVAITSFEKIFERLLYTEDIHKLSLKDYLKTLLEEYERSLSITIDFTFPDGDFFVESHKAAHIGMVFSELIGNSVKHSLYVNNLVININVSVFPDELSIVFADNGKPVEHADKKQDGLGRAIIDSIIRETLSGDYTVIVNDRYISLLTIPLASLQSSDDREEKSRNTENIGANVLKQKFDAELKKTVPC